MSFGVTLEASCPSCGHPLEWVDYEVDPPPIPPPRGGYKVFSHWLDPDLADVDRSGRVGECPRCDAALPADGPFSQAGGRPVAYVGTRAHGGTAVARELEGGRQEPLIHRVRHSPTGLEWGYGGSGPADLARSILWDWLGREPTQRAYMALKFDVVARLAQAGWRLPAAELEAWCNSYDGPLAAEEEVV